MKQIVEQLRKFRKERDWEQFHTPEALARALIVEAAELNELFLWGEDGSQERIAEELADVFIYALNMADICGFDVKEIIQNKIAKNAVKYPAKKEVKSEAVNPLPQKQ